jgi:hypothetical protein
MLEMWKVRKLCLHPLGWCIGMSKPGVGRIHLHSRLWRPGKITSFWYVQPDGTRAYEVPKEIFKEVSGASSPLEAMAILRAAGVQ